VLARLGEKTRYLEASRDHRIMQHVEETAPLLSLALPLLVLSINISKWNA